MALHGLCGCSVLNGSLTLDHQPPRNTLLSPGTLLAFLMLLPRRLTIDTLRLRTGMFHAMS